MKGGLIKLSSGVIFQNRETIIVYRFSRSFRQHRSILDRCYNVNFNVSFVEKKKKKRTIAKHNYRNRAAVNVKPSEIFFSTKFYFHRANFIKNSLVFLLKKTNREQTL